MKEEIVKDMIKILKFNIFESNIDKIRESGIISLDKVCKMCSTQSDVWIKFLNNISTFTSDEVSQIYLKLYIMDTIIEKRIGIYNNLNCSVSHKQIELIIKQELEK